jgi:hypothetical protein
MIYPGDPHAMHRLNAGQGAAIAMLNNMRYNPAKGTIVTIRTTMRKRCNIWERVGHRARADGRTQDENTGQGIYKAKEYGVSGKHEYTKERGRSNPTTKYQYPSSASRRAKVTNTARPPSQSRNLISLAQDHRRIGKTTYNYLNSLDPRSLHTVPYFVFASYV